ncbi:MAG TPA: ATP-binding protein [Dissulfurispiraceae bacterium]|nr:ATP-binding protein [Dissulfurispiraceae bacterium]
MNIKRSQIIIVVGVVFFVFSIVLLGWFSSKKVREVVTDNFNQQQLVLARNSAKLIEHDIESLKSQLSVMAAAPYLFDDTKRSDDDMKIIFLNIRDKGGVQIRYVDRHKLSVRLADDRGVETTRATSTDINYLKLQNISNSRDEIFTSRISIENLAGYNRPIINFVKPVKKGGAGLSAGSDNYSGVLIFVVDAYSLISRVTQDIVSGMTGHAFVIDQNNIFLYHNEQAFIGRDSTVVRGEKSPEIPFERINDIQVNHMLKGEEGTDWYISGWHRGEIGEMKKLIAYTPIRLTESGDQIWSIAVIAPISEVEDAIHSIQVRLFLIQLLIISGTLVFGLLNIHMLINWSKSLQKEVDRKTLEFKLSEEKYKSLVENADDIIFTVDHNLRYLSINRYGMEFFHKKYEDIIGHSIENIIPHPFVEDVSTIAIDVFTHHESVKFTHYLKMGENEYWLNTKMRRLYDEESKTYTVLGISRDISATKKKEIEKQMYHTEKLASMGTLAAGVAHEINNPLAIILGFSDLLLEKTSPCSSEYTMLKTIEKHALNAKKVVEGLLSFARYSEQKEEICDINKNIEVVVAVVKNTLAMNSIRLKSELQPYLPPVKGDPGKFQQVFLNLINNAIHAMKGGGSLSIKTRLLDDEFLEIRFCDTGHGIRIEDRDKIFDPLFTTKKVGEGTGLGLSVCYGIISQHGGKITFETETKEESRRPGTTFIITLPIVKTGDSG